MRRHAPIAALLFVLIALPAARADVRLPALFGSQMVIQRDVKVPIWGWADEGEAVTIKFGSFTTKVQAKGGKWRAELPPTKAGKAPDIVVIGKNTITLTDVLSGEVWVCSGQSNMAWWVSRSSHAQAEIAAASYPNIRLFTVAHDAQPEPVNDVKGSWQACSPTTVPRFSAVAYAFGRHLFQELKVPIGLVNTAWGGTPAEAWTSRGAMESMPPFKDAVRAYEQAIAEWPNAKERYAAETLPAWQKQVQSARAEGKRPPKKPREPADPRHDPHSPCTLYNGMVAPLAPMAFRGVIWYQGESNSRRPHEYAALLPLMIQSWRDTWKAGDFPFLIVQLANFKQRQSEPTDTAWAVIRDAQARTAATVPNAGLAVTIDIGEADNIHPGNKQDVGKRLALVALAKTYGKNIVCCGPTFDSVAAQAGEMHVKFRHTGSGLTASNGQGVLGFAVAGEDRRFVWADAKIQGDTVVVSSAQIARPVAVRYAWGDNPLATLYNKEGLPAVPFRSDDWPIQLDAPAP